MSSDRCSIRCKARNTHVRRRKIGCRMGKQHSSAQRGLCGQSAEAIALEFPLNRYESMRAEVTQRHQRKIVVISRWKTTNAGPKRTGQALELAAHHLGGILDLLCDLQRTLNTQDPSLEQPENAANDVAHCNILRPFDEYGDNDECGCETACRGEGKISALGPPFFGNSIDLIAEQQRGRTPSVAWFTSNQVNGLALAKSPRGDYDFLLCDDVVFLDHSTFEFARYMDGEKEREQAYTIIARDVLGDPIDIVAWQPASGRLATWLNRASILGEDQLNAPRLAEGLPVYETPLQWLQQRRLGVVVIDAKRAAPKLREAAPLLATTYEHGMALRAMLKAKAPRILLSSSTSAACLEPTSAPRAASEEAK